MTVSVGPGSTTTGQQGSPSQTVLITKQGPGIVASTTTNQLGGSNVGPATVGPAHLQQQQQPSTTITSNLAGNVQPNTSTQTTTQTIINAAGGLRVLNMNMNVNAVQAAAVGAASSTTVPAGAVAASPAQKVIAPRMILSPQMIGARPGQPGEEEYQSEFSEFLMLNYKQSVNEESKEGREDVCGGGEGGTGVGVVGGGGGSSGDGTTATTTTDDYCVNSTTHCDEPSFPSLPSAIASPEEENSSPLLAEECDHGNGYSDNEKERRAHVQNWSPGLNSQGSSSESNNNNNSETCKERLDLESELTNKSSVKISNNNNSGDEDDEHSGKMMSSPSRSSPSVVTQVLEGEMESVGEEEEEDEDVLFLESDSIPLGEIVNVDLTAEKSDDGDDNDCSSEIQLFQQDDPCSPVVSTTIEAASKTTSTAASCSSTITQFNCVQAPSCEQTEPELPETITFISVHDDDSDDLNNDNSEINNVTCSNGATPVGDDNAASFLDGSCSYQGQENSDDNVAHQYQQDHHASGKKQQQADLELQEKREPGLLLGASNISSSGSMENDNFSELPACHISPSSELGNSPFQQEKIQGFHKQTSVSVDGDFMSSLGSETELFHERDRQSFIVTARSPTSSSSAGSQTNLLPAVVGSGDYSTSSSSPNIRYAPNLSYASSSPASNTLAAGSVQPSRIKSSLPSPVRIPPNSHHYQEYHQQQITQPQNPHHQHQAGSNVIVSGPKLSGSGTSPEYKSSRCFTSDAQLHSQFLQFNQQHPLNPQELQQQSREQLQRKISGVGPGFVAQQQQQQQQVPVQQGYPQHPHPAQSQQQPHHPSFPDHSSQASYGRQNYMSIHQNVPSNGDSGSSRFSVPSVPVASHGSELSYPLPRPNVPTHGVPVSPGCDFYPPPSSSASTGFPYSNNSLAQQSQESQHNVSNHYQSSRGQPMSVVQQAGRVPHSPTRHGPISIPMLSPPMTRHPMPPHHKLPSPSSYSMAPPAPRWMNMSHTSSLSSGEPGSHRIVMRGQNLRENYAPVGRNSNVSSSSLHSTSGRGHPSGDPNAGMNIQYPLPFETYPGSDGSFPGVRLNAAVKVQPRHQTSHHHNVIVGRGVINSSNNNNINRVQNMNPSIRTVYPNYSQDPFRNSGGQYVGSQQQQQYYSQQQSGQVMCSSASGNLSSNNSNSSGNSCSAPGGPQQYPLVCRVSPIRSRYEDPSQFSVPSYSQQPPPPHHHQAQHHLHHLPHHLPRPPPPPLPSSALQTSGAYPTQDCSSSSSSSSAYANPSHHSPHHQYHHPAMIGSSGAGRLLMGDFNYPYESQYNDARSITTQITLQALPGLQPGAQGHHLLVKTETGHYQLLRVGMSTQPQAPPTAASVTNPPPTPPSSSSHVAQSASPSVPSMISSGGGGPVPAAAAHPVTLSSVVAGAGASSSSTPSQSVMTSNLQSAQHQSNLAVGTMTPSSNVNIVVTTNSGAVLNSIMTTNPVNSSRLPMISNLVHTHSLSTVPSVSSTSAISSTTNPSPVLPVSSPTATATYRLQTVPSVPPTAASTTGGMGMTASVPMQHPQQGYPPPQHTQMVQGTPMPSSNASATANSVSQMTAETAKMKCKNFLSFLLELSAKQNATVARNVKALIQGLVDGKVNAEDFSERLQKEVNSQPQPCLVGFLKKSLPHLRQSLATRELTIDGIRPPSLSSIGPTAPVTALIPQNQQVRPQAMPTPVRIITPINSASTPAAPTTTNNIAPIPRSTAAAVVQRFAAASKASASSSKGGASGKSSASSNASSTSSPSAIVASSAASTKSSGPSSSKSSSKEKDKKGSAAYSGYSGDDDINDVAAMGGVNLAEESQRILGSTEFVGTQIRSCKDETFLPSMLLQSRIKATAAKYGIEDVAPEVAAMISHATEERLKNLLEKLSVIAEHRLDVIKADDRYEISQDVKGQLRFLEELDKLERKRHDEQEREILIKAAKSRSKSEDPEQAKLKAKAKEMQRVALEEMRQREANLTALQAIGPRKKPKLDTPAGSQSTMAQTPLGGQGASSSLSRPQIGLRPRLKRVNLRDLLFLMEQDKETQRSHFLYKNLLLK